MEEIEINKKLFSKTREVEIREDVIVPDVKPDIINILDCNALSYIYKIEKTNEKIRLDGNVDTCTIYMSADGETRCIQNTFNFNDILDEKTIKEESIFKYDLKVKKIEAKVLNERKITCFITIEIVYNLYRTEKVQISNNLIELDDLQKRENNIIVNSLVGLNSAKASLKEELKVENIDTVAEILKIDINIENPETKISYNKVLSKVGVNISIIYLTEDDRISKVQETLPLMSFIDIENVKEENLCDIDYKIRNVLIKNNNNDEHSILCQIEFELMCEVYERKNINIVSDIYSLNKEIKFDSKSIEIDVKDENNGYPVKIDERFEIESIKKVLEIDTNVRVLKNSISGENSNIEGEIEANIYYESTVQSGLSVKKVNIPFISKIRKTDTVLIKTINKEFDLEDDNVILHMGLELRSKESSIQRINMVDNVTVTDENCGGDYSMVVYFVKPGDSIWKIAKNLKVTMDSIIKINNLENPELIHPGDKLYILK